MATICSRTGAAQPPWSTTKQYFNSVYRVHSSCSTCSRLHPQPAVTAVRSTLLTQPQCSLMGHACLALGSIWQGSVPINHRHRHHLRPHRSICKATSQISMPQQMSATRYIINTPLESARTEVRSRTEGSELSGGLQGGELLCYCDRAKVEWYLARGLADLVQGGPGPTVIRLRWPLPAPIPPANPSPPPPPLSRHRPPPLRRRTPKLPLGMRDMMQPDSAL